MFETRNGGFNAKSKQGVYLLVQCSEQFPSITYLVEYAFSLLCQTRIKMAGVATTKTLERGLGLTIEITPVVDVHCPLWSI